MGRSAGLAGGSSTNLGRPGCQLLDLDRDAITADHHGSLSHAKVVRQDLDLVVLRGVELDDGAAAEPQHLMDRHRGGAENNLDAERNLAKRGHFACALGETCRPARVITVWLPER